MAKETKLSDSADIYAKRETQSEKDKLNQMSGRDKFQYFKDYYWKKVLVIGLSSGLVIWFLYTVFSPRTETILYAAIINDYLENEKTDAMTAELEKYFNLNPKNQEILLDSSYSVDTETASTVAVASQEKLVTYIAAKQIDVIIADESFFQNYAYNDYFLDLADQLPTDVYSHLSDYYFTSDTDSSKEQNTYGIYLTESQKYKDLGTVIEKPVIGIVANSKYRNNAADFIAYLYDLN